MSAPLELQAFQLRNLADALDALTRIRKHQHVDVCGYGPIDISIGDAHVKIRWSDETDEYQIDDRNGS